MSARITLRWRRVGIGQARAVRVRRTLLQLHGGIGMTEELAQWSHYFRRCMVIERRLFGDTAHYLAKLAAEVA